MNHVILTCKNHPELRWSCKSIAYTEGKGFNGLRSIFYNGHKDDKSMFVDMSTECKCPPTALILAPESEAPDNGDITG